MMIFFLAGGSRDNGYMASTSLFMACKLFLRKFWEYTTTIQVFILKGSHFAFLINFRNHAWLLQPISLYSTNVAFTSKNLEIINPWKISTNTVSAHDSSVHSI